MMTEHERKIKEITIQGKKCLGGTVDYEYSDFDCCYESELTCDECCFYMAMTTGDKRKGKRPWAKKYQE